MKTIAVLAVLLSSVLLATAQAVEAEAQRPASSTNRVELKLPERPKPESELLRKRVTYSGFFADVARTNRPVRMLNLRQPADPIRDGQNLVTDPVTGRAMGFRLISINF